MGKRLAFVGGCLLLGLGFTEDARGLAGRIDPNCSPPTTDPVLVVGTVGCQLLESSFMGGTTAFSYYIPDACDPALERTCPVLYYLHGTGGSHREGVGVTRSAGNSWVKALTSGPPVDPRADPEPWNYADPATWVEKPPIDMIIVSPHHPTVAYGPAPDHDTQWVDWNPRYAAGGDSERYGTPPPRSARMVVHEIVPYVDEHFPTGAGRQWRAMVGYSAGGFGSFAIGLAHPDVWSSLSMVSGGGFPFPMLLFDGVRVDPPVGVAPPVALPYTPLPGPIPLLVPEQLLEQSLVPVMTVGFGDPVADNWNWRQANPHDMAANARAWAGDVQSTYLKFHVNDVLPRRTEDVELLLGGGYLAFGFEAVLLPTSLYLTQVLDRNEVEYTFDLGPGHHWSPYQSPYFREHLEAHYANLRHWDGGGTPRPHPDRFDYRTSFRVFDIWGWHFEVEREANEFLYLTDVTCEGLTVRGTGTVTFTSPCGDEGTVDLGPSQVADDPAGLGAFRGYGRTVRVDLTAE